MLKECLEVFEDNLKKKGEALILDSYVPADGTYRSGWTAEGNDGGTS